MPELFTVKFVEPCPITALSLAVVNISSISGQRGSVGRSAYGVSKAGIIQLTREMAVEFANMNILVNSIAPGPIITDITNNSDVAKNYR